MWRPGSEETILGEQSAPLCEVQLIGQAREGPRSDSNTEGHRDLELSDFGGVVGEGTW